MMHWNAEILRAGIISVLYLLIFIIAEVWRATRIPPTEVTRKFVHFASGAVCLSFSYLFVSHWTVLALSAIFVIVMVITKKTGMLQSVHGVSRPSSGGEYYPVAVYLSFVIASSTNHPEFYLIAFLVLAVSDSLAALVGGRYGFKLYKVEEEHKSLEGSIIFFVSTFLIVHLGLLLLSPMGRVECVLAGIYIAILITAFEAISLGGADNLFIPLGTLAMLLRVADAGIPGLTLRIAAVILMFGLVYGLARHTRILGFSAIIGIALTSYGAWMLVRYDWVLPVIISLTLLGTTDLFVESSMVKPEKYRIRTVFYIMVVSFVWVLAATFTRLPSEAFFVPYSVNLAANFSILWKRKTRRGPSDYRLSVPLCIRNARGIVRAGVLSLLLTSINCIVNRALDPIFTIAACFCGTMVIEFVYWCFEAHFRGRWDDVHFLKITAGIIMVISMILFLAALPLYYPEALFMRF